MKKNILYTLFCLIFLATACRERQPPPPGYNSKQLSQDLSEQGLNIVHLAAKEMQKQILERYKSGGVAAALEFCNLESYHLIDSVAISAGLRLKRRSLHVRNPKNAPSDEERIILKAFQRKANENEAIESRLVQGTEGAATFYTPILISDFCLHCHGQAGSTLLPEHEALINDLYPGDKAINYKTGDFRGMWVVEF